MKEFIILRKVVLVAIIASFLYSIYIAYEQTKNEKIENLATFERGFTHPFVIPDNKLLSNSDNIYPLLLKSAKKSGVNIFRGARHYRNDEQIEIIKYILLTDKTDFYDYIELDNGRRPKMNETQDSQLFLSSVKTTNRKQIGKIHYFDQKQIISIHSLKSSYKHIPVSGRYFVEANSDKEFQIFLNEFSKEINSFLSQKDKTDNFSYSPKDLQPSKAFVEPQEGFFTLTTGSGKQLEQSILLLVTLLLLIYYIFNSVRRIGILKLHGVSNFRLWWLIAGKMVTVTTIIIVIGVLIWSLALKMPMSFIYNISFQLVTSYIIFMVLSIVCYVYIASIKVYEAIKNKKKTNPIFVLNMLLKVICAVILIQLFLQTYTSYTDLREKERQFHMQEKQVSNWNDAQNYGIAKAYAGYTTAYNNREFEEEMSKIDQALYKVYPIFNELGALYVDARDYEQSSLQLNEGFSGILSITLNPNYLKEYPIYDSQGKPIQISESSEDWTVLVPEQYKKREKEIRSYFDEDKETRDFFLREDTGQKMKIIWTKSNQHIFTLNPDVFPQEENNIIDPIIHIKTDKNHLFTYRSGIKGFGLNDPLKVKLINQNPILTYDKIKPFLRQHKLDSIINIVSFKQYVSEELENLHKDIRATVLTMIGMTGIFIFLIVQNLIILFHKHQKRLVIKRLFGVGFIKTYQPILIWIMLTFGTYVLISFILSQDQPDPMEKALIEGIFDFQFIVIVLGLLCVEFLATIIALSIMERYNKIKIIKGSEDY
jgi:putative ABC transport system permease protein